jgi:hypothetical protein
MKTEIQPQAGNGIKQCACISSYQDCKYGNHMRVHNKGKADNNGKILWKCTVCGDKK